MISEGTFKRIFVVYKLDCSTLKTSGTVKVDYKLSPITPILR